MEVRKARLKDANSIKKLIDYYADMKKVLPKTREDIYEGLRDYFVAVEGKKVVGCCALHILLGNLAEIKSLAVDPKHTKKKAGTALLQACIEEARSLGIKKLFTLTGAPQFFRKNGFRKTQPSKLPSRIWYECAICPKFPNCDETLLVLKVKKEQTKPNPQTAI